MLEYVDAGEASDLAKKVSILPWTGKHYSLTKANVPTAQYSNPIVLRTIQSNMLAVPSSN